MHSICTVFGVNGIYSQVNDTSVERAVTIRATPLQTTSLNANLLCKVVNYTETVIKKAALKGCVTSQKCYDLNSTGNNFLN